MSYISQPETCSLHIPLMVGLIVPSLLKLELCDRITHARTIVHVTDCSGRKTTFFLMFTFPGVSASNGICSGEAEEIQVHPREDPPEKNGSHSSILGLRLIHGHSELT